MNTVRALSKFPLMSGWAAAFTVALCIPAVQLTLGLRFPAEIGATAFPIAAVVFGLGVLIGWILCLPFRVGPMGAVLIALALALGFQWALFQLFGTFMLYTPEEIERNRAAFPVLMSLEVLYAVIAAAVCTWLARSVRGEAHAV
jgi:hypothetical protein